MQFKDIFSKFLQHQHHLKVIFVGSADKTGKPNCAPKMLIDVVKPNKVFYLDYKSLRTYSNILQNQRLSVSFMDDRSFMGFRLNGTCRLVQSGPEFKAAEEKWHQRVAAHEAARMVERLKGNFSTREAEATLPDNFVVVRFTAEEGAIVKPGRVFRALLKQSKRK